MVSVTLSQGVVSRCVAPTPVLAITDNEAEDPNVTTEVPRIDVVSNHVGPAEDDTKFVIVASASKKWRRNIPIMISKNVLSDGKFRMSVSCDGPRTLVPLRTAMLTLIVKRAGVFG